MCPIPPNKFLGLIFDRNLSFIPHITNLKKKCQKALNLLKVVSHQNWGADKDTILTLYRAIVRSKLDYGSIVYGSARPSYLKKLEPIQNQALRLALGAFHTSPIPSLNALCSEPPLSVRRTKLYLSYSSKLVGNPQNPAYKKIFKNTYKDKDFIRKSIIKPMACRMKEHISDGKLPLDDRKVLPRVELTFPPSEAPSIGIDLELSILSKKSDSPSNMLNSFLQLRDSKYKDFNEIYTDGSKKGKKVGCAVIKKGNRPARCRLADNSTVYSAEMLAIKIALQYVFLSRHKNHVIFTDSEAAVKAFQNSNFDHPFLAQAFNILYKYRNANKTIVLCWIPGHVGIKGNEKADKEAKEALKLTALLKIPFTDIKPIISEYCNSLNQDIWSQLCESKPNKLYDIQKDLKKMPSPTFKYRSDETRYYRCLIGHSRMTHKYIYDREPQPMCECESLLKIKHVFTECPQYQEQRQ